MMVCQEKKTVHCIGHDSPLVPEFTPDLSRGKKLLHDYNLYSELPSLFYMYLISPTTLQLDFH